MQIIALGLNHRTAPVELREHLAFGPQELPLALARLKTVPEVSEAVLLSTCNRTELYALCEDPQTAAEALLAVLVELKGASPDDIRPALYQEEGTAAAGHLFRVASGLDSMVLGETQILGQVRDAYHAANQAGMVHKVMHHLMHMALGTAKRAQTETGINGNAVSVSYAAVELAKKLFQSLQGRTVMALGAGETAKLTVKHLQAAGATRILVANRTMDRARRLAEQVDGQPIPLEEIARVLPQVDVIISSTGAPGYVLNRKDLEEAQRHRRGRPVFLFDIAVPRDIDPECSKLDGVFLYDIDDLQQVVAQNLQERVREAKKAEAIIGQELDRFLAWLRSLEVVPTIRQLRDKVEAIRKAELARAMNRLPGLGDRERQVIEAMTVAMMNKFLNDPTQRLKGMAEEGEAGAVAEAVQKLFALGEDPPAAADAAEPPAPALQPRTATARSS